MLDCLLGAQQSSQKHLSNKNKLLKGSFCLCKIIAIANGIDGLDPFNHVLRLAAHILQEMCGAQLLSWSPLLHPKYNSQAFLISGLISFCWLFSMYSPQIQWNLSVISTIMQHIVMCITLQTFVTFTCEKFNRLEAICRQKS